MKITIFLKTLSIMLCLTYIFCMFSELKNIWFSLALIFIAVVLLLKSVFFVHDSKLWLGSFLLFWGIFEIYRYFYGLSFELVYPIYILIIGVSSLLVFAIFRQNIHLKVFVICFFEVLLLSIYKFAYISLLEFWFIQIAFLLFVISKLLVRAKINTRSN